MALLKSATYQFDSPSAAIKSVYIMKQNDYGDAVQIGPSTNIFHLGIWRRIHTTASSFLDLNRELDEPGTFALIDTQWDEAGNVISRTAYPIIARNALQFSLIPKPEGQPETDFILTDSEKLQNFIALAQLQYLLLSFCLTPDSPCSGYEA